MVCMCGNAKPIVRGRCGECLAIIIDNAPKSKQVLLDKLASERRVYKQRKTPTAAEIKESILEILTSLKEEQLCATSK